MPSLGSESEILSLEHLRRSEAYPKPQPKIVNNKGEIETVDSNDEQTLQDIKTPFGLLPGEFLDYTSRLASSNDVIFLTNYRLFVNFDKNNGFYNVPIRSIESVDCRDMFYLHIYGKDGRFSKLAFENTDCCSVWLRILLAATAPPNKIDALFAFCFNAWCSDDAHNQTSFCLQQQMGFFDPKNSDNFHSSPTPIRRSESDSLKPLKSINSNQNGLYKTALHNSGGGGVKNGTSFEEPMFMTTTNGNAMNFADEFRTRSVSYSSTATDDGRPLRSHNQSGKSSTRLLSGSRSSYNNHHAQHHLDLDSKAACCKEFDRLGFDPRQWRISELNHDYKLCSTYPKHFVVPARTSDAELEAVAKYRSMRRVPAVVWRHPTNGAVLARCSQPESGIFGWRSTADESLLFAILEAASENKMQQFPNSAPPIFKTTAPNEENGSTENGITTENNSATRTTGGNTNTSNGNGLKSMLILDARSYAAAWANRAKGGGYESTEYYRQCEIEFCGLANIHAVRYSFQRLRALCWENQTQPPNNGEQWLAGLDATQWTQHACALLAAARRVVDALHHKARPVVVHCSDGWDRTAQIVSLAKLMLDPYYRSMQGFKELIEAEWICFGHKFGERSGLVAGDINQRAPVFLQWLDCVHYLYKSNQCAFEFNDVYLVKLAQHTYSGLFGTFLSNSVREFAMNNLSTRTYSVWAYLNNNINNNNSNSNTNGRQFKNALYNADKFVVNSGGYYYDEADCRKTKKKRDDQDVVLTTNFRIRDLSEIWRALFSHACNNASGDAWQLPGARTLGPSMATSQSSSCSSFDDQQQQSERTLMALSSLAIVNQSESMNNCPQDDATAPFNAGETAIVDETLARLVGDIATKLAVEEACSDDVGNSTPSTTTGGLTPLACNGTLSPATFESDEQDLDEQTAPPVPQLPEICVKYTPIAAHQYDDSGEQVHFAIKPVAPVSLEKLVDEVGLDSVDLLKPVHETIARQKLARDVATSMSDVSSSERTITNGSDAANAASSKRARFTIDNSDADGDEAPTAATEQNGNAAALLTLRKKATNSGRRRMQQISDWLDADGLTRVESEVQERVQEIIGEYEDRLAAMQMEIDSLKRCLAASNAARVRNESLRSRRYTSGESSSDVLEPLASLDSARANLSDTSWEAVDELVELAASPPNNNQSSSSSFIAAAVAMRQLQQASMMTSSAISGGGSKIPTLWMPDHTTPKCMLCGVQFWAATRRHHCRSCGMLFCNACSNYECAVPAEQFYQPVRVCRNCFVHLSGADTDTTATTSANNAATTGGHEQKVSA